MLKRFMCSVRESAIKKVQELEQSGFQILYVVEFSDSKNACPERTKKAQLQATKFQIQSTILRIGKQEPPFRNAFNDHPAFQTLLQYYLEKGMKGGVYLSYGKFNPSELKLLEYSDKYLMFLTKAIKYSRGFAGLPELSKPNGQFLNEVLRKYELLAALLIQGRPIPQAYLDDFCEGVDELLNRARNVCRGMHDFDFLFEESGGDAIIKTTLCDSLGAAQKKAEKLEAAGFRILYIIEKVGHIPSPQGNKVEVKYYFHKMGKYCSLPITNNKLTNVMQIDHPGMHAINLRYNPAPLPVGTTFLVFGQFNPQQEELLYLYAKFKSSQEVVHQVFEQHVKHAFAVFEGNCTPEPEEIRLRRYEVCSRMRAFTEENADIALHLRDMGQRVNEMFLFGRPIPAKELEDYIDNMHRFINRIRKDTKDLRELEEYWGDTLD